MLGFSAISDVAISDIGSIAGAPLNINLVGQQLTLSRGAISFANRFVLTGFGLTAQQGSIVSGIRLPVLPPLVTHQGNLTFVKGPAISGLLMQARQGQIAIRKEVYFLYADGGEFALTAPDAKLFHSVFSPDPLEGTIIVYNTPFVHIEISEDA